MFDHFMGCVCAVKTNIQKMIQCGEWSTQSQSIDCTIAFFNQISKYHNVDG